MKKPNGALIRTTTTGKSFLLNFYSITRIRLNKFRDILAKNNLQQIFAETFAGKVKSYKIDSGWFINCGSKELIESHIEIVKKFCQKYKIEITQENLKSYSDDID